jgi:hypothetical protein
LAVITAQQAIYLRTVHYVARSLLQFKTGQAASLTLLGVYSLGVYSVVTHWS